MSDDETLSSSSSSDDGEGWEEVPEGKGEEEEGERTPQLEIPKEGITITIPSQNGLFLRKKKGAPSVKELVRLQFNRVRKERQEEMHKVSLLCLLSRGIYINDRILNGNEELKGLTMSLLLTDPPNKRNPNQDKVDKYFVQNVIWRWKKEVVVDMRRRSNSPEKKTKKKSKEEEDRKEVGVEDFLSLERMVDALKSVLDKGTSPSTSYSFPLSLEIMVFSAIIFLRTAGIEARLIINLGPLIPLKPQGDDLIKKPKEEGNEDEEDNNSVEKKPNVKNDKKENLASTSTACSSKGRGKSKKYEDSDDEDFELDEDDWDGSPRKKKSKGSQKTKKSGTSKPSRLGKSSASSSSPSKSSTNGILSQQACMDYWVEVFLQDERKWVPVDVESGKMDLPIEKFEERATKPLLYIVAFNNNGSLKDVTRRYCNKWFQVSSSSHRVEREWWEETLAPFVNPEGPLDRLEDKQLDEMILKKNYPAVLSDLRNHPIYTCERFFKKHEVLYPPNVQPAGKVKGNITFYLRDYVKPLFARENWLKQAKVVRIGEKPAKLVKGRAKFNKDLFMFQANDKEVELFGEWQVEDYIPPIAKDGKVPRNAFGNVELFKPQMLPRGCVHLPVNGLNRIARKLDIDCAPAIVGFDFGPRGSHPVYDGFIVCQEHAEVLMDAWNQDQDEARKKEEEKTRNRAKTNWRRLIKLVMIGARLNRTYGGQQGPSSSTTARKNKQPAKIVPKPKPKKKRARVVPHDSDDGLSCDEGDFVPKEENKRPSTPKTRSSKESEGGKAQSSITKKCKVAAKTPASVPKPKAKRRRVVPNDSDDGECSNDDDFVPEKTQTPSRSTRSTRSSKKK